MAYSIGPRFNDAIDVNSMVTTAMKDRELDEEKNKLNFDRMMTGIKALGSGIDTAIQHKKYNDYMDMVKNQRQALLDAIKAKKDALAEAEVSAKAPEKVSTELTAVKPFEGAMDYEYDPEVWEKSTQYLMHAYPEYNPGPSARNKYKIGIRAGL